MDILECWLKMLPNLFCLGAPKAGSSYLFSILSQHPEIYPGITKEHMFFRKSDEEIACGIVNYELNNFRNYKGQKIILDCSPGNLHHADPRKIKEYAGEDSRMIIVVRNPARRAFSEYHHSATAFAENRTFLDAVRDKTTIIYSRSLYYDCTKRYLDVFERNRFLFLKFENHITGDINSLCRSLWDFLELRKADISVDKSSRNETSSRFRKFIFGLDIPSNLPLEVLESTVLSLINGQADNVFYKVSPRAMVFLETLDKNLTTHLEDSQAEDINNELFREDIMKTQDLVGIDLSGYLDAAVS